MNGNYTLKVLENIGVESKATFGEVGSLVKVKNGSYVDLEYYKWENVDGRFDAPQDFINYFNEKDCYRTKFEIACVERKHNTSNGRDFYLSEDNVFNRLLEEYNRYGKIIIAYDFDDTIYDFHKKGRKYTDVIDLLKRWKDDAVFICFTASKPERQRAIWEYIISNDIPCDYLNEGVPGLPNGDKKIYYNVLLDDRAGLGEVYGILNKLINHIEMER